jgi:hypothetical protein
MFFGKKSDTKSLASKSSSDDRRDEEELAAMGYKSEFKREFTNLGTISFAFSIMYVVLIYPSFPSAFL